MADTPVSPNPSPSPLTPEIKQKREKARAAALAHIRAKGQAAAAIEPGPRKSTRKRQRSFTNFQIIGLVAAVLGAVLPFVLNTGLDPLQTRMLAIFFAAIFLWISEAIPLAATAVMVIFAEVLMISNKTLVPVLDAAGAPIDPAELTKYDTFFAAMANPVIILFLGGFMIADGAAKYGLDRALAATLLRPFLGSPRLTLLGLMGITALLSMFMSNTATTATMFAVLMPVLKGLPAGKSRTGIALSIPIAANVGGMGTPVGTPPNAIAIGALNEKGITVTFAQWMMMAVPIMLIILVIAWFTLAWRYLPKDVKFDINLDAKFDTSPKAIMFYVIAGLTVALWTTEALHGISSNIVGFFPVVAMMALKVMVGDDVRKLDWPVLWLVAGGIALGKGVGASHLDEAILGGIPWGNMSSGLLLGALAIVGFLMSNVISHSASANLLVPLGIGLAVTLADSVNLGSGANANFIFIAAILALGCSLGMCLPISTPPNAIAYSTGEIPTPEMAFTGIVVGLTGVILLSIICPPYWMLLGIG